MKTYQVQVRLSYYAWVEVEAIDEHNAQDQAIRKAFFEMDRGNGSWGEEPEVMELVEIKGGEQ